MVRVQENFKFEGNEYNTTSLSENALKIYMKIRFVQDRIVEIKSDAALIHKAKNGYIEELKNEILSGKLGLNIGELFLDD